MNIKQVEIGVAVERAVFRAFTVSQDSSNKYTATVTYVMGTFVNDTLVSETPLLYAELTDQAVREHPQFATLYPLIQTFTRSLLASSKPELVE